MSGIYVHIPFCSKACHYCDFHFSTSLNLVEGVISCIQIELKKKKHLLSSKTIKSIYFGGGTPSAIHHDFIFDILNTIKENFNLSKNIECTIEMNPDNVSPELIRKYYDNGINRVSLGVQSFRDCDLLYMNRSHNGKQALESLEILNKSRISNINVDLIYGYPTLDDKSWIENLKILTGFNVHHISCYCMTVEKKTALEFLIKKKKLRPLEPDTGARQFKIARDFLTRNKFTHYEISNYSIKNFKSVHNQNYWNHSNYIGVGPSAHSFVDNLRQWNINNNKKYCDQIHAGKKFYQKEKLNRKNIFNEYIFMNLRSFKGLDISHCYKQLKPNEIKDFNNEIKKLENLNVLRKKNNLIYLNEKGMLISDNISSRLFLV